MNDDELKKNKAILAPPNFRFITLDTGAGFPFIRGLDIRNRTKNAMVYIGTDENSELIILIEDIPMPKRSKPNRPKTEAPKYYQCPHCDRHVRFVDLSKASTDGLPPLPGTIGMCGGCGGWWLMSKEDRLTITKHQPPLAMKMLFLLYATLE